MPPPEADTPSEPLPDHGAPSNAITYISHPNHTTPTSRPFLKASLAQIGHVAWSPAAAVLAVEVAGRDRATGFDVEAAGGATGWTWTVGGARTGPGGVELVATGAVVVKRWCRSMAVVVVKSCRPSFALSSLHILSAASHLRRSTGRRG